MGSVHARGDTFLTFGLKALTETNTSRLATATKSKFELNIGPIRITGIAYFVTTCIALRFVEVSITGKFLAPQGGHTTRR
jgi:hypothetical protein